MAETSCLALQTRKVQKFYGKGRNAIYALQELDVDVPHGKIYGLLGASGCGKTTLLRCALGRLPIQSGHILILGKPPGTRGHNVPGKGVGYMPQEEALAPEFTMREMMYYFGILFNMKLSYIKERIEFLREFLELNTANALCKTLSGGQRRRVSLAVALLHEPPLLILDEPTVGLDPLLRAKIWGHLLEITSTGNSTIIITTHYIEEARQANVVGLMRSGRLLAQSPPETLIKTYGVTNLEDVFLKILEEQMDKISTKEASIQQSDEEPTEDTPLLGIAESVKYPSYFSTADIRFGIPRLPKLANVVALSCKEAVKFVRQPALFFFLMINSTIQVALVNLTYGQDLRDITVYYNNYDTAYHSDFFNGTFHLGRSFLSHIDEDTLDLKLTRDVGEGIEKIEEGRAWGYFRIPKNYTENYIERLVRVCEGVEDGSPVYPSDVSGAAIEMFLDVTNTQIYYAINDTLINAILAMRRDFLRNTSIPEYYFNPLIKINNYVYGGADISFTDYLAPGSIAGWTFIVSITFTALNLVLDKKSGLYDRTWVAGVSVIEVVTSQVTTYSILALLQAVPETFVAIYAFDVKTEGSILLVIFMAYLVGICGLAIGLFISMVMSSEETALQTAIASFYPFLLIGGIFWPTEGFDKWLQMISRSLPLTYPAEAIRSILIKGWGVGDEPVYLGMIIPVVWTVIVLIITCLGLQIRKS